MSDIATLVPEPADTELAALAHVLDSFARGEGVPLLPSRAELTTQQAADAVRVSRPFLIGLLDAGQIDYHPVGTDRRVKAASLIRYLREVLIRIGLGRLVQQKWTDPILDEVFSNLRANRPDADDRHLLAAAIHAEAEVIDTKNLRDFPADRVNVSRVQAQGRRRAPQRRQSERCAQGPRVGHARTPSRTSPEGDGFHRTRSEDKGT